MSHGYYKIIARPKKPPEQWSGINVSLFIGTPIIAHSTAAPFVSQRSLAIEEWGHMRETTVKHFKFTPRTSLYAFIWAFAVPFGVFSLIKWELRRKDRMAGRKERSLV